MQKRSIALNNIQSQYTNSLARNNPSALQAIKLGGKIIRPAGIDNTKFINEMQLNSPKQEYWNVMLKKNANTIQKFEKPLVAMLETKMGLNMKDLNERSKVFDTLLSF